jgi:hypothetical protein
MLCETYDHDIEVEMKCEEVFSRSPVKFKFKPSNPVGVEIAKQI